MSKTVFNSYLIKAIVYVLKQFFRKNIGRTTKKHGGGVKLILNNLLSTRDYVVFYPVLVYIIKQLFHSLSSYTADSRLGAKSLTRLVSYQLIYDSSS